VTCGGRAVKRAVLCLALNNREVGSEADGVGICMGESVTAYFKSEDFY
jgi:hypothetical protein